MDIGTHALASLALSRAILPRAPRILWAWTISAGIFADSDQLSALVSPSAYLAWHRTYTHSVLASLIIAVVFAAVYRVWSPAELRQRLPVRAMFVAVLLVQWLHAAMDAAQWQDVEIFWPFSAARIAADWFPTVDPWIIAILVAAVALPELFHLVSSEIGAKDKRPRGFVGAIVGLVFVVLYIGVRGELHGTAIAQFRNRVYVGENPRRVAAFAELTSLVSWRGIADTESALHEVTVNILASRPASFDPGVNLFKPEPSPLLQAAQATESAKRFLRIARFPKATVVKTEAGTEVQIRDLRYAAADEQNHEPMVTVDFDLSGKLQSEAISWASRETPR
ncbi:MAG: metal-dependent hydrolase [Candidatus Acidiferrum sp.]